LGVKLSERIKRWREDRDGLTVPELAKRLKIFPEAVYQWESGTTQPTIKHLEKVASILGISLEVFYGEPPPLKKKSENKAS
jgi:transcriptional regulator with XRE-family HTH domain